MSYLPSLPSFDTVKGYFTEAKTFVTDSFNTYYPVVRDTTKDFAGRLYIHIKNLPSYTKEAAIYAKETALEHPFATAAAANFTLFLLASKIQNATTYVFKFAMNENYAKKASGATFVATVLGANYGMAKVLELAPVPVVAAASLGLAGVVVVGRIQNNRAKAHDAAADEFRSRYNKAPYAVKTQMLEAFSTPALRRASKIAKEAVTEAV